MSVTSSSTRRDGGGDGGAAHQTRGNAVKPYLVAIYNSYTVGRQRELEDYKKDQESSGANGARRTE